jgi:hypothetical protein
MLGLAGALLVGAAVGATEPPTADGSRQPAETRQRVQPSTERAARSAAEQATPPSPIAEPYQAPPASYDVPHRAPTPLTQPTPQP